MNILYVYVSSAKNHSQESISMNPCDKFKLKSYDEWAAMPAETRPHIASLAYCADCNWIEGMHPVIELAMCEYSHLVLKPNQLYKFVVREDCSECVRISKGE